MSVPTTLFGLCRAREVVEYYFCRCTWYGPWYCGLTCAPCLAFSIHSLVLTERASPIGWFQSALIVPVGDELWVGVWRILGRRRGSKSEIVLWPGLSVGEAVRRRARDQSKRSGRRGGSESDTGVVPPRPDLPVGDWIVLRACCPGI